MNSAFRKQGVLYYLVCFGAVVLSANLPARGEEPSPKIKALVDESTKQKGFSRSGLIAKTRLILIMNDVPEMIAFINKHPDYTSYQLLLALKWGFAESYKKVSNADKAAVLCSALKNSTYVNDWGYLHTEGSSDDASAKALLELGKDALDSLTPILDDSTEAPLWGSADATMSVVLQYRRKDFAYRYVALILGESPVFEKDPKERDKAI